jgi:PAS domain S-box-containing protein
MAYVSLPPGRVRLVTFPPADSAFRAHVETALDKLGRGELAGVEAEVREAYPSAVVRARDAMAGFSIEAETWYAYRDGSVGFDTPDGAWWDDESLPRTRVSAEGRYVDANDAAADLFGVDRDRIVGSFAGAFTRHESDDAIARRLFSLLAQSGELHSTAVVLRPDGQTWPIEFHMVRGSRAGEYVSVMRRI